MDAEKLVEQLTVENVIELMRELGASDYQRDSDGNLKFQTICHGGDSKKLYYYHKGRDGSKDKIFRCYSCCGTMSVFNLIMQVNGMDFGEAYRFLARFMGVSLSHSMPKGFNKKRKQINDWDFINLYKKVGTDKKFEIKQLPFFTESCLNAFENLFPSTWIEEGITHNAMGRFGIKFSVVDWKAILPHRDYIGHLIGIRGRSFLLRDLDAGRKYMPVYVENEACRHPLQFNLYGIYENKETIKRLQKVILFEGEKSVLQCESFYPNNNFSVALCGTNISNYQRDLLIYECEIKEVIIALDKQYVDNIGEEGSSEFIEYQNYIKKVTRIADGFVNYVNVFIVYCGDNKLEYKDSPSDKGKEVLEQLMKKKERYERKL